LRRNAKITEADRERDPLSGRDAHQHPASHQARERNHDCWRRGFEWPAASAHVAAAQLPRRQATHAVQHEDRSVRENRQPLERAGDREHEHDDALQEDRGDGD